MDLPKYFQKKNYSKFNISDAKEIALFFKGKILSKKASFVEEKLSWKCKDGHIFNRAPLQMKIRNTFCPSCKSFYLGEEIVRKILEKLTKKKFEKIRHKEILSELGNPLEIDGFNKSLKLGFEHQGRHHYLNKAIYTKGKLNYSIYRRDKLKLTQAKKVGIDLIIFPEIPRYLNVKKAIKFAKEELKKRNIKIFKTLPSDILPVQFKSKILELNNLAKKFGGKLISKNYLGMTHGYMWKCKNNHIFKARAYNVKTGWWCRKCSYKEYAIKDLKEYAIKKKGKCLSLRYYNIQKKYKWKCKSNHTWYAPWASVQRGTWCAACSGNKAYKIEKLMEFAESKSGKLLSKKYINTHHVYDWQCKKGHKWSAAWHSVRRGTWCRHCAHITTANKNRGKKLKRS